MKEMITAVVMAFTLFAQPAAYAESVVAVDADVYRFDKHDDFNIFWSDLQLAVQHNDKRAVAKMMLFPFSDYEHSPVIFQSEDEFIAHYDELFDREMVELIKNNRYRPGDPDQSEVLDAASPEGFVIEHENSDLGYNLVIEKVDGVYKIVRVAFYS
ncbi:hypothetical protein SOASR030_09790 [Leminorella grimontii]|uniref:Uncharacterized protein n=1 Tax=Leminorella grimontii TaxID=82981 RepID=A0AAV5N2G7_9GAMM|nr:hypothetical protein [Leminorella grimontii]KFC95954.1 hypothetical protein GLGR_1128 [Leminorella grimontii ATCC 33999 = DSM 5078]GKX54867.1 hypothetical protein SOASR030_09790 [Leminorella grimontii]GKX58285.1 hypothetical protein SOASR031_06000 [Leminorella grimontii]VFS58268.1 Uncharacterised protein [Leminorella grimontii]